MRRKGRESKLNMALTALLVVFVCLLSFSIGVISGKGWSDREYKVRHIENDSHLKAAQEDAEPLGDEMTEKEVELLTKRALEQERAKDPRVLEDQSIEPGASLEKPNEPEVDMEMLAKEEDKPVKESTDKPESEEQKPKGREASMASAKKEKSQKRKVSSIMPKPTTPPPTSVEYTVQVASYKTVDEAEKHSQTLIDKGFPAFPIKAMVKGKLWYRVSIGSFKNRKQAMKYEKALKKQAVVNSTFVQKIQRLKK